MLIPVCVSMTEDFPFPIFPQIEYVNSSQMDETQDV